MISRYVLMILLLLSPASWAKNPALEACPEGSSEAVTTPAPVDAARIAELVSKLRFENSKNALKAEISLDQEIKDTFDLRKIKTKMEQFYRLLFVIAKGLDEKQGRVLFLNPDDVRAILLEAKVFTDPAIPREIRRVMVDFSTRSIPKYEVHFNQPSTTIPLNGGKGFYIFRNGKCQHAQALIFEDHFRVTLQENGFGRLVARNFKGVDLFGDFGNRGAVDVDIEYVSLRAVEFYTGTNEGKVTAYVSREEFKKNEHSAFLEWVTLFVADKTIQPIDW